MRAVGMNYCRQKPGIIHYLAGGFRVVRIEWLLRHWWKAMDIEIVQAPIPGAGLLVLRAKIRTLPINSPRFSRARPGTFSRQVREFSATLRTREAEWILDRPIFRDRLCAILGQFRRIEKGFRIETTTANDSQ